MKKLFISALLLTGVLASAGAWADAECQAGSAWGTKPGCDSSTQTLPSSGTYGPYYPGSTFGYPAPVPNSFSGPIAAPYPYQGWNWNARPRRVYRNHTVHRRAVHTAHTAPSRAEHHRS